MTAVVTHKRFALTFYWTSTDKITGTQHHHKLILHSSYHVQRLLVVSTKVEEGTIRLNKKLLLKIKVILLLWQSLKDQ